MVFRVSVLAALCCVFAPALSAFSLTGTRWSGSSATLQLQLGTNTTALSDGSASWGASAEDALAIWNAQLAAFRFAVVRDSTAARAQGNRINNVHFSSDVYGEAWGTGVLAVTLTYAAGTTTTEADVVFNNRLNWDSYRGGQRYSPTGLPVYDFHRVALHEFGHALGLDHPDEDGQTVAALMNSRISSLDTIASDDIQGGQALYGSTTVAAAVAPVITAPPASRTIVAGQSTTFAVTATGTAPLTYQWLKAGVPLNGATGSSFTLAAATSSDAGTYAVTVANSAGSVTSAPATLTVTTATTTPTVPAVPTAPTAPTATAPQIITSPSATVAAVGQSATFAVTASGTAPLTYQWRKNGFAISGATTSTYALAAVQPSDAGSYAAVVSNSAGSVTSASAALTVTAYPEITAQPSGRGVALGAGFSLSVAASGTGPMTYQWRKDGTALPGATSATFAVAAAEASHAGGYVAQVSNSAGTVTSATAHVVVGTAPSIATQPSSQVVAGGSRFTLTVGASGSPAPTYQWFKSRAAIPGATAASYTVDGAELAHEGVYEVTASNAIGSVTSAAATITLSALPVITTAPVAQTVTAGQRVELSVGVNAAAGAAYQWFRDGVAVAGANGAVLVLDAARPTDNGAYTLRVTNPAGSVTSAAAVVTVKFSRLVNLSTRGFVPAGGALTPGFFIRGGTAKPLLIRAVGPTLSLFGVSTALGEAKLEVIAQGTSAVVASNADWGGTTALRNAFATVGAFPLAADSKDAAVQTELPASGYTVRIVPGEAGMAGITLAEIYDSESILSAAQLVNVSTLGYVGTGENLLTAGFVISGNAPKRLLIRAVGPGLLPFGVTNVLADPQLGIVPLGATEPLATNDDWPDFASVRGAFATAGAFNLTAGSKDAAIVITLDPGAYTAVVSGVTGTSTGNALVEIYDLDP